MVGVASAELEKLVDTLSFSKERLQGQSRQSFQEKYEIQIAISSSRIAPCLRSEARLRLRKMLTSVAARRFLGYGPNIRRTRKWNRYDDFQHSVAVPWAEFR